LFVFTAKREETATLAATEPNARVIDDAGNKVPISPKKTSFI
jgi:uncharacterized protein involved in exopolysaccharide biosynthesis